MTLNSIKLEILGTTNVYIYIYIYVLVKALLRVYTENTARGGHVSRQIQHEAKPSAVFVSRHPPSAVFFIHTSVNGALIGI